MVSLARPLPERLAGIGVLMLGVAWSLGMALANWDQVRAAGLPMGSALLMTTVGGMLTVAGVWFGVGAVAWAMGRLLGGKARFVRVLFAVSAAAPPLWIAAPVAILALTGESSIAPLLGLVVLGTAAALGFLASLVTALQAVEGFSWYRAFGCAVLTFMFCASYLSLQ
jgi:hypothetical protein